MVSGIVLALIEVSIIFVLGYLIKGNKKLKYIDIISYYWLFFTVITGIWEFSFLINYNKVCESATQLLTQNNHVWTNSYSLINILPDRFAILFYSEYGAYADREYMLLKNNWSRIIEGSHCVFCGLGALLSFIAILWNNKLNNFEKNNIEKNNIEKININKNRLIKYYLVFCASSMSSQAMNSILYITNYFHQTNDPFNINYNSSDFPTGFILNKRAFMYINIMWTIMPLYVLYNLITRIRY